LILWRLILILMLRNSGICQSKGVKNDYAPRNSGSTETTNAI
jgi:hypothetical protein